MAAAADTADSRLHSRVARIVARYFDRSGPTLHSAGKAVHDSVWGTYRLEAWEASLLDNPLTQRLRGIHQTALAFLTFPTALHTRFDHSLGVAVLAGRLLDALEENGISIEQKHRENIRAACLLHDIGHGPFSHLSEEAYRHLGYFEGIIGSGTEYEGTKEHEYLSCAIIRTTTFREFLAKLNERYEGLALDVDSICDLISGDLPPKTVPFFMTALPGPSAL